MKMSERQNCIDFLSALESKMDDIDEEELGAVEQINFGCKLFAIAFDVSDEDTAKIAWKFVKPHFLYYIKNRWFLPSYRYHEIMEHFPENDHGYYYFVKYMIEVMRDSTPFRKLYTKEINHGNFGDQYDFQYY